MKMKYWNGQQGSLMEYRKSLGESQKKFWSRIGVTQSSGSRLENCERVVQPPHTMLLLMAYGNQQAFNRVMKQLREHRPKG